MLTKFFTYVFIIIFVASCGQDFNSNTFDKDKYGTTIEATDPASARLLAAYTIINAKCVNCHSGDHDAYATYTTDEDWINQGLVVPGDFDNSFLRNKLKNFGGNMPTSGSDLTTAEVEVLREWVDNL